MRKDYEEGVQEKHVCTILTLSEYISVPLSFNGNTFKESVSDEVLLLHNSSKVVCD